jgi:hypothetical protein
MKFPAVEDIPDIETSRVDIKKLDPFLYEAVDSTRFALRHWKNFKARPPVRDEADLISLLRTQLEYPCICIRSNNGNSIINHLRVRRDCSFARTVREF